MADLMETMTDLAHHFLNEAGNVQKGGSVGIDDLAVHPVLDAWAACLEWARTAKPSESEVSAIAQAAHEAAEAYGLYQHAHGKNKGDALQTMQAHLDIFPALFEERVSHGEPALNFEDLLRRIDKAQKESAQLWSVMVYVTDKTAELDRLIAGVREAETNATAAVGLAQQAATKSATSALESSFQKTAKRNAITAWVFRGATVATLLTTVVLGAVYAGTHVPTEGGNIDWYGLVYRVAVLSGLGAIAAYLGRQAGNYTRISNWAHGIAIQLKAFLGFVNEIDDAEARQTMFALFGKRVLEAPPDGKSSDEAPTNVIQPIFEQAAKLRPSPQ